MVKNNIIEGFGEESHSRLGVAEVWRLVRGRVLIIEQLQADGSYASVEESRFLRVRPEDILQWLNEAATEPARQPGAVA